MYTPTEKEMIDIGMRAGSLFMNNHWYSLFPEDGIEIRKWNNGGWAVNGVKFYPRSLDHLKQIILAFNPTE